MLGKPCPIRLSKDVLPECKCTSLAPHKRDSFVDKLTIRAGFDKKVQFIDCRGVVVSAVALYFGSSRVICVWSDYRMQKQCV
jgi:hypothetical protein